MKQRIFYIFALLLTTATLAAQTPPDTLDPRYVIDEAVVMGSAKDHVALLQQPISFTSVGSTDIERRRIASPKDISALAPNLYMPTYGSRLTSAAYIRGVGSRSGAPAVGMYIDDVPVMDKSLYDFELLDAERIDILRGPAGTLYGRSAMGGLLRITTADPLLHRGTNIMLAGSTRNNGLRASAQTYLHPASNFALSIGGFVRDDKGFRHNATTDRSADAESLGGLRMRAAWKVSDAWRLDLTASYQYSDEDSNPYVLTGADDGAYFPNRDGVRKDDLMGSITQNRQSSYRRSLLTTGFVAGWTSQKLILKSVTSLQFLRDRLFMDQDYIRADIFSLNQKQRYGAFSEELLLRNRGNQRWQWTSGLFVAADRKRTTCPVTFYADGVDFLNTTFQRVIPNFITLRFTDGELPFYASLTSPGANIAVFHQSTLKDVFTEGLSLTAGFRLDYEMHRLRLASSDTQYNYTFHLDIPTYGLLIDEAFASQAILRGKDRISALKCLPKMAVTYELPNGKGTIYGSVSRGYRAGGYNMENYSDLSQNKLRRNIMLEMKDFSTQTILALPLSDESKEKAVGGMAGLVDANTPAEPSVEQLAYEPETSWNHEVGCHLKLGELQLDAAAFWMRTHDLQVSRFATSGMGREIVNAGESRTLGAEIALNLRHDFSTPKRTTLDATLAYGLADSKFTSVYKGKRVPFAPLHTLALTADVHHELGGNALRAIFAGLSLTGEGNIYWDEANTMRRPFAARLNASLGIELWDNLRLTLWGRNLTNGHYEAFSFLSMSRRYAQYGEPFHLGFDLRVGF